MSRDKNTLHPDLLVLFELFSQKMKEAGLLFTLTCAHREIVVQMALYVQGRMDVQEVNRFRKAAGLTPIKPTENKVVTWTLESKHTLTPAEAFDIVLLTGDKVPHWNLKIDVNQDSLVDYEEAGNIGETIGLVWGGRFGDRSHFELQR